MTLEPESISQAQLDTKTEQNGHYSEHYRSGKAPGAAESATNLPQRGYQSATCETCGAGFRIRASELKRGGGRGKYCSRACRPVGMSATRTRQRARDLWIERHNGAHPICRVCAKKADIHHVDGDPLNNLPGNHDRLCRSHHTSHEDSAFPRRKSCAA